MDAELLFSRGTGRGHEGVMAYAQRFVLRALALHEAEVHRRRLMREG